MSSADPTRAQRVTGNLKLIQRRGGPVWYVRTRVPGRRPEDTLRRLAPAHLGGGKPAAGHLTRRQARDALADLLAAERRRVGQGAYDYQPDGATFGEAAAGSFVTSSTSRAASSPPSADYRLSISRYLDPRWGDRPAAAIGPRDVEQLRDDLLAAGLSAVRSRDT